MLIFVHVGAIGYQDVQDGYVMLVKISQTRVPFAIKSSKGCTFGAKAVRMEGICCTCGRGSRTGGNALPDAVIGASSLDTSLSSFFSCSRKRL